ncbi:MAG TPA: leucine-rich repeat protein [Verrucomicrobiae bacterium]|jgi:hypothetical protein
MKKISLLLGGLLVLAGAKSVHASNIPAGLAWVTNAHNTISITSYTGPGPAVSIPSAINNMTVTTIESEAFLDNVDITSVTIPSTITEIQDNAFDGCGSLTGATIPSSVTTLGIGVFRLCSHMTAITVDAANPNYTSQNGVLFNKSMTTLIEYPESVFVATAYTIPNGVTTVDAQAFWGCSHLLTVVCPASVTSLGDTAFIGCNAITSITFMGNAPKPGSEVFLGDTATTAYYYSGAKGWGTSFAGIPTVKLTITLPSGAVEVTLTPAGAISAGAKWQADHGANETSGMTVSGLSVGNHVVTFTTIPNWTTPASQTVAVANGQTNRIIGVYTFDGKGNPMVAITAPKPNQVVSNPAVTLTGTATDIAALNGIQVRLDSGVWTSARQNAGSWSNWFYSTVVAGGTHTFSVYATDTTGSVSKTNSVSFKYIPSSTLTVATNGLGSVNPVENGRLLAIGANYTLTAMPKLNWIFSSWVATGGASFVSNNPVLHFKMAENLELTANFVTNVFRAAQGTYNGLFEPLNQQRAQSNSGAFTLTVASAGMFSGKLTIGTSTTPLTGKFNPAGAATVVTSRHGLNTLTTSLQLNFADQSVRGTVTDGSFDASVWGDKEVFSASHPAANFDGHFTMFIGGSGSANTGPPGLSHGTVTVSPAGAVTFMGSLADGTSVSQMSFVSKDGHWPMYVPLYNGKGSILCSNIFAGKNGFFAVSGSWINETNASRTAVDRAGFTNDSVLLQGRAYAPTNGASSSTELSFSDGGLSGQFNIPVNITANDMVTMAAAAPKADKLFMTINKTTGNITGSFANPSNPKQIISFTGVELQNPFAFVGYFLNSNIAGVFIDAP